MSIQYQEFSDSLAVHDVLVKLIFGAELLSSSPEHASWLIKKRNEKLIQNMS